MNTNQPSTEPGAQWRRPLRLSLRTMFLFVACAGVLFAAIATLLPAILTSTDEHMYRNQCQNNLKQLGLALLFYNEKFGSFPPARVVDAHGRALYSWRVLVLPLIERRDIADLLDHDEAWNGPHNATVSHTEMLVLHCPADRGNDRMTEYLAVVGPNTAWPGNVGRKLSDIKNPTKTILLVESADTGIDWAEPRDLDINDMLFGINRAAPPGSHGISSHHEGSGANVLFADGHVEFLDADTDPEKIKAMLDVRTP